MAVPSNLPSAASVREAELQTELLTFLIADVRGYSTFTHERGDEAAGRLVARFAALTREVIIARGGRLIELRGDEALIVFPSPRQALRAAAEMQNRFRQASEMDSSLPLPVGIGVDAGEAVLVEGGYRGGALNLAARLCDLAQAGEVLATETVVHLARKIDGIVYLYRGQAALKGFAEPIRIVRVVDEADAAAISAREAGAHSTAHGEVHSTSKPGGSIRVMLVDDHSVVRQGMRAYLEMLGDVTIVGEAGDGQAAMDLLDQLQIKGELPEVVVMDLVMPRMDGIAATAAIAKRFPMIRVVALTSFVTEDQVQAAMRAGAAGYVLKDSQAETVASAIRDAFHGEVHLDPIAAKRLMQSLRTRADASGDLHLDSENLAASDGDSTGAQPVGGVGADAEPCLTEREREILELIGLGWSNREISQELGINERRVRVHVTHILGKLDLTSRVEAMHYALREGLVSSVDSDRPSETTPLHPTDRHGSDRSDARVK